MHTTSSAIWLLLEPCAISSSTSNSRGVSSGIVIAVLTQSASVATKKEITDSLPPLIFRTFVYAALIAVSEELIFRGVLYQVFHQWYTVIVAVVAPAALWATFHLPGMAADGVLTYQLIFGLLTFIAFGAALALATMLAGGSLWVPIGVHHGYNLTFSLPGAFFSTELSVAPFLTGASNWFPETGIEDLIVWAIVAVFLYTRFMRALPADRCQTIENSQRSILPRHRV